MALADNDHKRRAVAAVDDAHIDSIRAVHIYRSTRRAAAHTDRMDRAAVYMHRSRSRVGVIFF